MTGRSAHSTAALVSAAVMAVSAFLPWRQMGLLEANGTDGGDGVIVLAAAAAAAGAARWWSGRAAAVALTVCGLIGVIVGGYHLHDVGEDRMIDAGVGLYLLVGAGVGLLVASENTWRETHRTDSSPPGA
jgi:hypothetical protein